jgi:DNA-binding XRE family transcriptional regulator
MKKIGNRIDFAALVIKSGHFAELMEAYLSSGKRIQKVVVEMVYDATDPAATVADRERATAAIAAALFGYLRTEKNFSKVAPSPRSAPPGTRSFVDDESSGFGYRLKELRMQKNVTQEALAKKIGVRQSAISMMESGQCRPRARTIQKLAQALKVTEDQLWPQSPTLTPAKGA